MARPGGNPDLKGNKNSGRKSAYEEGLKIRAVEKAWGKIMKKLDGMSDQEIKEIALPMVLKSMPDKIEGELNVKKFIIERANGDTDDKTT